PEISDLKTQADAEHQKKRDTGKKRGPQDLLARRFAKRDARHDPDTHQNPRSSPMMFMKSSSSDIRCGVNWYTSAPADTRERKISGRVSREVVVIVSRSSSTATDSLQRASPETHSG